MRHSHNTPVGIDPGKIKSTHGRKEYHPFFSHITINNSDSTPQNITQLIQNTTEVLEDTENLEYELLSGKKERYTTKQTKKCKVTDDRSNFVFQLSRFTNDGSRRKLLNPVNIDQKIKLKTTEDNDMQLELTSFIVHQGSQMSGGHYVTYLRTNDKGWIKCDGSSVTKIDSREIKTLTTPSSPHSHTPYYIGYSKVGTKLPDSEYFKGIGNTGFSNSCYFESGLQFMKYNLIMEEPEYVTQRLAQVAENKKVRDEHDSKKPARLDQATIYPSTPITAASQKHGP